MDPGAKRSTAKEALRERWNAAEFSVLRERAIESFNTFLREAEPFEDLAGLSQEG